MKKIKIVFILTFLSLGIIFGAREIDPVRQAEIPRKYLKKLPDIHLFKQLYWGMSKDEFKDKFPENLYKNLGYIELFIVKLRHKKFKYGLFYFADEKLAAFFLEYKIKYFSFSRARKEIIRLTKAYGEYKEIKFNNKKSYKWTGKKTLLYYRVKFKVGDLVKNVYLCYFDKNNLSKVKKLIPEKKFRQQSDTPSEFILKSEKWYGENHKLSHTIVYEYTANEKIKKIIQYNSFKQIEQYTVFKYVGKVVLSETVYAANNKKIKEKKYKIKNNKHVEAVLTEYRGSKKIVSNIYYKYNQTGKLESETWKEETGKTFYIVNYFYVNGKIEKIEHTKVYKKNNKEIKEKFKTQVFIYDGNQNITFFKTYNSENKLTEIIEYIYEDSHLKSTIVKTPYSNYVDRLGRFVNSPKTIYTVLYNYVKIN